jgi:voltage-gated potassium channel
MYSRVKDKVYSLLDPNTGGTALDKVINTFIILLILLNTVAVITETVERIFTAYRPIFDAFEVFSVAVFSIEYILRVWCCTSVEKYKHPVIGRLKYIFTIGALIDLLAIIPFYLPLFGSFDLRFVRLLRLVRFFRFFKISRYLHATSVVSHVFEQKKGELVLGFLMTIFLIVIASSTMYFVEHDAQPHKFSSIPETMWWSVATLTTVGYGDMYPITALGKTLTSIISILGIGLFALPAGILASGFSDEFKKTKKHHVCPHCGKDLD